MKKSSVIGFWIAGLLLLAGSSPTQAAMMGAIRPELIVGINDMFNGGGALGYEAGLDLAFWLGPMADLTVGAQYLSRAYTDSSNTSYLQIPAIVNLHLGHMFSIGGGAFYDFAITSGAPMNYGITGSMRLKPVLMPFFFEGRYNYGLNTTDFGTNSRELQVLFGFIF